MEMRHDPEIQILLCDYREGIAKWNHKNVCNSCWYYYWNNTPGALMQTAGVTRGLSPNDFCLIAPETVFSTGMESPFNHFYLHFTVGAPFDQIKSKIFFIPVDEMIVRQVGMIRQCLSACGDNSLQLSLLSHAVVCCLLLKVGDDEFKSLKRRDPRVEAAVETLNRITSRIVPNESLAAEAGIAVNGFIRLFAKELGVTPQKYSRRKRIEKASILLHFTNKKIDEIAEETGFLDRYHFSRAFKETTSYSPAEFRRRRISLK